jgi:hypothetical protein
MDATAPPPCHFASLPVALARRILASLPVDTRARCACVCRSWNATLDDARLWRPVLDLTPEGGVACGGSAAALRGASRRAAGGLREVYLSRRAAAAAGEAARAPLPALRELLAAHPGLTALHARGLDVGPAQWEALLAARGATAAGTAIAPLQVHCDADWWNFPETDTAAQEAAAEAAAAADDARAVSSFTPGAGVRALWREGACAPLRFASLRLGGPPLDAPRAIALLTAAAAHDSLRCLTVHYVLELDEPGVMRAVVDAAVALALPTLEVRGFTSGFWGASLRVQLPRLLRASGVSGCALRSLTLARAPRPGEEGAEEEAAPALLDWEFAAALRANRSLTALSLSGLHLRNAPPAALAALRDALAGHPSLRALSLDAGRCVREAQAIGTLLGPILLANAPTLTHLSALGVGTSALGYTHLLGALPRNAHLRTLALRRSEHDHDGDENEGNEGENEGENEGAAALPRRVDASAAHMLLPAVRDNGSLRALDASLFEGAAAARADEAVAFVEARERQRLQQEGA